MDKLARVFVGDGCKISQPLQDVPRPDEVEAFRVSAYM